MSDSKFIEVFENLKTAVKEHGDHEESNLDGVINNFYTLSEICYSEKVKDGNEIPLGILFELFGLELLLNPEGLIASGGECDNIDDIYEIDSEKMLQSIHDFLVWRHDAINKFHL